MANAQTTRTQTNIRERSHMRITSRSPPTDRTHTFFPFEVTSIFGGDNSSFETFLLETPLETSTLYTYCITHILLLASLLLAHHFDFLRDSGCLLSGQTKLRFLVPHLHHTRHLNSLDYFAFGLSWLGFAVSCCITHISHLARVFVLVGWRASVHCFAGRMLHTLLLRERSTWWELAIETERMKEKFVWTDVDGGVWWALPYLVAIMATGEWHGADGPFCGLGF